MNRRRVIGWTVGVGAIVVVSIGTLAAIPSGGQRPAQIPIPTSATTAMPQLLKLGPAGEIPKNIAETVLIPVGMVAKAYENLNAGGANFDGYILYQSKMRPRQVLAFFKASLPDAGWHLYDASVTKGQDVILASKAGNNGFYWEVGIKDPYPAKSSASELQLRILQVSFS
ncbi:hypothetical protein [Ferrimicrobium acidiphilum]|uniref:Uncharacterized protein n=1 Tax=Ferrimicrobium acidiphilum DSM 19497 TaxID=1121877 RepID=A0A0D8FRH9_9ACTN|nr:hypothetical protein [Ferrimicrobium acidiphilum]KJE75888.1 hypothetical protein FEAC_23670 [Ferrimicrobium acidiphilum DSM 19497]